MEQNSQVFNDGLYKQIEDAYGKVLYTYTTHIIHAGRMHNKNRRMKWAQIICSAISTGGFIGNIITNQTALVWVGGLFSTVLLVLTAYFKDIDLGDLQRKHMATANALWRIREDYISLLTDYHEMQSETIRSKRDELQARAAEVYDKAPLTDAKSYAMAQDVLKNKEAQFFTQEEMNKLLPQHLRK